MASTTYTIFVNDEARESKGKKQVAIDLANSLRDSEKAAVRVETNTGRVVHEQAAPKKINMSPRYSRVVELPEGVVAPEGKRVAYFRPRTGLALLHDMSEDAGDKPYSIFDIKQAKELARPRFATTREGGVFLRERAEKLRDAKAAEAAKALEEKASSEPTPEPSNA